MAGDTIHIRTDYNRGFSWIISENIRFIGYLTEQSVFIPDIDKIEKLFAHCNDFAAFTQQLSKLNGVFSIILNRNNKIFAASDPTRFFPLFYYNSGKELHISDDVNYIRQSTGSRSINAMARTEYLAAAFTGAERTLYQGVKQIRPGEALSWTSGDFRCNFFYSLGRVNADLNKEPQKARQETAKTLIDEAFERHLRPLQKKPILLPLSGGIDSRLIACQLKRLGFTDVTCFTYGRKTHEVEISRRVADKLGFPWHFVEYNADLTGKINSNTDFAEYYEYQARGNTMFYLQEYPAVKHLMETKVITQNHIALPGHPGDLLRGSIILKESLQCDNIRQIAKALLRKKFYHCRLSNQSRNNLLRNIEHNLTVLQDNKKILCHSLQNDWELKERTSKYIINSSHVFTFFGIKCFFPLADRELLSFFHNLPLADLYHGKLYNEVLHYSYFRPLGLDFKDDIQPGLYDYFINDLKKKAYPYLPMHIKEKRLLKNDWPEYERMSRFMVHELNEKKGDIKHPGKSYLYRLLNWYLMQVD